MSLRFERALAEWRECRAAFDERLEAEYALAEDETGGVLLNDRGREKGVDPIRLFYGNAAHAYAYASPELVEYWERRPRLTFAAFEASWPYPEDDENSY